jgi:hypothetical protein
MDWQKTRKKVGWAAAISALASLVLGCWGVWQGFDPANHSKVVQAFVLGLWILVSPIWFWAEYFFLYKDKTTSGVEFEAFKHGQDQAAKIWLALITILAGLYFGKDLVRESPPPSDKHQSSSSQQSQPQSQPTPSSGTPASSPPTAQPQ